LLWLQARRGRPRAQGDANATPRPAAAMTGLPGATRLNKLRRAFEANDARAARDALLLWASRTWPEDVPTGLDALARRLPTEAGAILREVDGRLYAQNRRTWDGAEAWRRLEPVLGAVKGPRRRGQSHQGPLPPLYPSTR
jgi:hypothetical protein